MGDVLGGYRADIIAAMAGIGQRFSYTSLACWRLVLGSHWLLHTTSYPPSLGAQRKAVIRARRLSLQPSSPNRKPPTPANNSMTLSFSGLASPFFLRCAFFPLSLEYGRWSEC